MENRGSTEDHGDEKKARAGTAPRTVDLTEANIKQDEFAEEFLSDLPTMAVSSAHSDFPPFASAQSTSTASKVNENDSRNVTHGSAGDTKKLEHALPGEPMPASGSQMVGSLERRPVVLASRNDIAPGAFSVRSSPNTAMSRTFRSPNSSYDNARQFTTEESKQEDVVPNFEGGYIGAHDSSRVGAESGLYTVEAQRVPDGNEEETMMVAEAEYVRTKWYQRRWISLGSILFACALLVVVVVVLVVRPQSTASSSSLTSPTTAPVTAAPTTQEPTSLTPEQIACNFLSFANVTKCQSIFEFSDKTTGSTIPSEIGVLTQLTFLDFTSQSLTSTIPREIGLLTQLTLLDFNGNALTSTIPSEIRLLNQLTRLDFGSNSLTSTIPSELGLLSQLTILAFFSNKLTSTIPSEIGLLNQLTELSFWNNSLTSTIPSDIGLLTLLTWLSFWQNSLTTISTEIGLLTLLAHLDISSNSLISTIPSEIGLLTQLTYLSISRNSLTFTIPSEIGHLTLLRVLDLFRNELKGTIPSSLCSLPTLSIRIDCGEITCASGCCTCV
jgi:Leucine-rich repeat (LRR) protein